MPRLQGSASDGRDAVQRARAAEGLGTNRMADGLETELKLVASPAMLLQLRSHLLLEGAGAEKALSLVNRYFDTRDGALDQAGAALRLRQSGARSEQTFKTPGDGVSRGEWNAPATGDAPDPAAFAPRPRKLIEDLIGSQPLKQLALTRIERTTRRIRFEDSTIEAAFDFGTVEAGRRHEPICELELELVKGCTADLFALARRLPLGPELAWSTESKSERGRVLALKPSYEAVRATEVPLSPDMTVGQGFRAIAWNCLTQLLGNYREIIASGHPDAVHQSRVAIRRLRAALGLFASCAADEEGAVFRAEWKAAAAALGPARDLHVLLERVEAAAAETDSDAADLIAHLRKRRTAATRAAKAVFTGEPFQRLLAHFAEWLERMPAHSDEPLTRFASNLLGRRHRKLVKIKALASLSEEALHELRIKGKKQRYASEFFASLYPDADRGKDRRAYGKALTRLQDSLGSVHDLAVAQDHRASLFAGLEPIAAAGLSAQLGELIDGHGPGRKRLVRAAGKALERVAETPPWWKAPIVSETRSSDSSAD